MKSLQLLLDSSYYKRTLKIFLFATILFTITICLSLIFHPSLEAFNAIKSKTQSNEEELYGLEKLWRYLLNNGFRLPFQMLMLSFIPIPFLYLLNLISTVISTAIAFGFAITFNFSEGMALSLSSLPHFILEILAMCLFISALYNLNQTILKVISNFFKRQKNEGSLLKIAIFQVLIIFFLFVLPLNTLAAFTETYITELLFNIMT